MDKAIFRKNKFKPLNFDHLLLKQLFFTSMMANDPVITVKISDIAKVYNFLVQKDGFQWIKTTDPRLDEYEQFEDPLNILRQELDNILIETGKESNRQLNLRIKCRFLVCNNEIIKCTTCTSPVIDTMIPGFDKRYRGMIWSCKSCRQPNKAEKSRCMHCRKCIPQELTYKLKDNIFDRY